MTEDTPDVAWLDQHQQRSWRAFLVGTTLLMDRLDRELREQHRLSLPEYEILVRLSEADGHRHADGDAGRLGQPLPLPRDAHRQPGWRRAGLVARDACLSDGRGVEAVLTDQGRGGPRRAPRRRTWPAYASSWSTWWTRTTSRPSAGSSTRSPTA